MNKKLIFSEKRDRKESDMTEGEFDLKEEEPWYDHQDLEHGESG